MKSQQYIGWFEPKQFKKQSELFEYHYKMVDFITAGEHTFKKKKSNGRYGDNCLFCGKSYPTVQFKNAPHLLSNMLGSDLYSKFECDECNSYFSKLETDFASYLGIGRSFTRLDDSKKTPGFSAIGLEVKTILFKGHKIIITKNENQSNTKDGVSKLMYGKPTYTPSNVYKLLLKYGLSVLPIETVTTKYNKALEFLKSNKIFQGSIICIYKYPLTVKMPLHVHVFRKKDMNDKLPTDVISLYFDNVVITLPIPFHLDDMTFWNESITIPVAPPYFIGGHDMGEIEALQYKDNLSSPNLKKNEPEELSIAINRSDPNKSYAYNLKTGESSEQDYNPSDIKFLIATQEGVSFTKEELHELNNIIQEKFRKA